MDHPDYVPAILPLLQGDGLDEIEPVRWFEWYENVLPPTWPDAKKVSRFRMQLEPESTAEEWFDGLAAVQTASMPALRAALAAKWPLRRKHAPTVPGPTRPDTSTPKPPPPREISERPMARSWADEVDQQLPHPGHTISPFKRDFSALRTSPNPWSSLRSRRHRLHSWRPRPPPRPPNYTIKNTSPPHSTPFRHTHRSHSRYPTFFDSTPLFFNHSRPRPSPPPTSHLAPFCTCRCHFSYYGHPFSHSRPLPHGSHTRTRRFASGGGVHVPVGRGPRPPLGWSPSQRCQGSWRSSWCPWSS